MANLKQVLGFTPVNLTSRAAITQGPTWTQQKIQQNAIDAAKATQAAIATTPTAAGSAAARMMFPGATGPSTASQPSAATRAMFPNATGGSAPVAAAAPAASAAAPAGGGGYGGGYYDAPAVPQEAPPSSSFYQFDNSSFQDAAREAASVTQQAFKQQPLAFQTPKASISAAKPSIWVRLLQFLGFKKGATISGEMSVMADGVAAVVNRARAGDQNAMALIALIRDNAARGNARARISMNLLMHYIKTHPV